MDVRKAERLDDLDLLRFLAILLVVVHEALDISLDPAKGSPLFVANELIGLLGVGVFLFISGYLLKRRYPSIETPSEAWHFLSRRGWRIYPLYWLFLVVALAVGQMAIEIQSSVTAGQFLIHLLGLQMVFFPALLPGRAFWFIGAIVACYLAYPLLVYRNPTLTRLLLRALAVLLIMVGAYILAGLFGGATMYFPTFVMGIAAGATDLLRSDRYQSWRRVLAVAAVPAIGFAFLVDLDNGLVAALGLSLRVVPVLEEVASSLLAVLCFVVLVREAFVRWTPESGRVLMLIGAGATASYAVYLVHSSLFAVLHSLAGGRSAFVLAACLASIPVLFVLGYYLQLGTDRLVAPTRLSGPRKPGGG